MRRFAWIAVLAAPVITLSAFGEELRRDTTPRALDCTLYTKPYTANQHSAYVLPARLKWNVMPRYVGRTDSGERIIDDRLTLVLVDADNSFWPVISQMSIDEAESLQHQLAGVIAQKRAENATQDPPAPHKGIWIDAGQIIVVIPESRDVIAAYSIPTSRWRQVKLERPLPSDNSVVAGRNVVAFQTDDSVYAFSAGGATWARQMISKNSSGKISVSTHHVQFVDGNNYYIMGSRATEWSGVSLVNGMYAEDRILTKSMGMAR